MTGGKMNNQMISISAYAELFVQSSHTKSVSY